MLPHAGSLTQSGLTGCRGWEHALDRSTCVLEESASSDWGSNHLHVQCTLVTLCQYAASKLKELN